MDLLTAVKATYEVVGQDISDLGMHAVVTELTAYPLPDVMQALTRCRKELRRITLADILDRLPGGHPGPEEAWSIVSRGLNNESVSFVWTDEMATAYGSAMALQDDPIAARMAFREVYGKAIAEARAMNVKPIWKVSLGFDPASREQALREAVEKRRISLDYAQSFLPTLSCPPQNVALPAVKAF